MNDILIVVLFFAIGIIIGYILALNFDIMTNISDSIKSINYDKLEQENEDLRKALGHLKKN